MIIKDVKPYIGQLQLIDIKSYECPWFDEAWKTVDSYQWGLFTDYSIVYGFYCYCPDDERVFLSKLAVRPKNRGQGIGSKLMESLIIETTGKKLITILHEENKYLGWAKLWGWRCTGVHRELFPDGRDGLIMER